MPEPSYVLTVAEVVRETEDACSVIFEVPPELREEFAFAPGQFLTIGVPSDRTGLVARCYSLSSTPHSGRHQITVKRTEGGYASHWVNDHLAAGDTLRVQAPSGIFTPASLDTDVLLFAGGSGITPVISIARSVLERGTGEVVLLYGNRDERSVIFAGALADLAAAYPDRCQVVHWLESVQGLPSQEQLRAFAARYAEHTAFVCGPGPFMSRVVAALKELGFPRSRRHQEKFVSLGGNPFGDVEEVLAARAELADADDHEDGADDVGAGNEAPALAPGPVALPVEPAGEQQIAED